MSHAMTVAQAGNRKATPILDTTQYNAQEYNRAKAQAQVQAATRVAAGAVQAALKANNNFGFAGDRRRARPKRSTAGQAPARKNK